MNLYDTTLYRLPRIVTVAKCRVRYGAPEGIKSASACQSGKPAGGYWERMVLRRLLLPQRMEARMSTSRGIKPMLTACQP